MWWAMPLMLVQEERPDPSSMSDKDAGAGRGGLLYGFNRHRDALYKILESAVRDKASEGNKDDHASWSDDVGQALSYPTPILWFEDMRPADLDAYHAANRRRRASGVEDGSLHDATVGSAQGGGDFNRSSSASKDDAAVVAGTTAGVGGGIAHSETTPERLVSNDGTNNASRPAAAGEKDVLREMKPQPLPPSGASATLKSCSTDEAATPKRALHDINGVKHAGAEEPSTAATATDVDGACFSNPFEAADRCTFAMTPTMTQPGPSQATQTTFLPGLPSQVLMTQQRGDADEWEHAEEDESQQDGFLPDPYSSLGEDARKRASLESARRSAPLSIGPSATRNLPGRNYHGDGGEAGRATTVAAARGREEARSRQNEDFIRALRELVERGRPSSAGIESRVVQSAALTVGGGDSGSGDRRGPPPFTFVPTEEVLPSGWSGGQAEAVAFLENRLIHARERVPDGYAIRALELACHILRQPAVCVKATGRSAGASMRTSVQAMPQVDEDRPEVVGVAGFVWKLLDVGSKDAGRKPAPRASQI